MRWEFDIPHTQSLYLSVHQPAATASSHAIVFAFEPAVIFRSIMALFNVDEEVTFVVKTPASHLLTTPAIVAESAKAVVDLVDVDVAVDPSPAALVEASNRPSSVVATTVLPAGTLIASVVAAEEGKLVPLKKKQILGKNQVLACFDYTARNVSELSLVAGSVVNVIGRWDANWWKGESNDDIGFFPANHVQGLELVELMEEECKKGESRVSLLLFFLGFFCIVILYLRVLFVSSSFCFVASTEINYQDSEYFDSYSTLTIHHQMLNDKTRTIAYRDGVVALAAKIKGKLVLDIGCGTGILSMFCARAGAEHVVGVDASSIIKIAAQKVIEENGLQKKITLMTGKLEEIVADLPYPKYDVIISEWMGTFLICESMIESVLWAKDQLLKEGGLLLPSTCSLFLVPVSVPDWYDEKIQFWDSVYGINMSSLKALAKQTFIQKPSDQPLKPVNCLCAEQSVMDIDMHTYTLDQLESNRRDFAFEMTRDAPFHGFGSWFEVHFGDVLFDTGDEHSSANNLNPVFRKSALVTLPTGPDGPLTHWKQISFLMEVPIILKKGQTVSGTKGGFVCGLVWFLVAFVCRVCFFQFAG